MRVTIGLAVWLIAYVVGCLKLRRRARGTRLPPPLQSLAFSGGILVVFAALASPLDALADRMLSGHMVQHLLLMLIAPPLFVWARPIPYWIWSLPLAVRKFSGRLWNRFGLSGFMRFLGRPTVTWILFCGTVILWHVPALYRWAIGGEIRHSLMHLSFFGSGLLFWSVVMEPGRQRRLNYPSAAIFVLSAALITGLPGALIAFARHPIYLASPVAPVPFGLTALGDQQLAGLIMWIPMDLMLFSVALVLFALALRGTDRRHLGRKAMGTANLIQESHYIRDARRT